MKKNRLLLYFAAMCCLQFLTQFSNTSQGTFLSDHIAFYSLMDATQGLISTAQSIGGVIAVLSLIFLSGRVRNDRLLLLAGIELSCSLLLMGLRPPFPVFLLLYALLGIGFGTVSAVTSAQVALLFPGSGAKMGVLHALFGVGGLMGPFVFSTLRDRGGVPWYRICALIGCLALLITCFYALMQRRARDLLQTATSAQHVLHKSDFAAFFSDRRNLLLTVAIAGYAAFQNGCNIWIVRYFSNGLSAVAIAAYMLSVFWIGNTAARLIVPRIQLPVPRLLALGSVLGPLSLGAGVLLHSPAVMVGCVFLAGFFTGASVPLFYHLGCEWNPSRTLLSSSMTSATMYLSWTVTAPVTAVLTSAGKWTGGMLLVACYGLLGAALFLVPAGQKEPAPKTTVSAKNKD